MPKLVEVTLQSQFEEVTLKSQSLSLSGTTLHTEMADNVLEIVQ